MSKPPRARLRQSYLEVKYKDKRKYLRCYQPHLFSEYAWGLPGREWHKYLKIRQSKLLKKKWYKGDKRYDRESVKMMTEILEDMTDLMIEDLLESNNKLRFYQRNKAYYATKRVLLGIYNVDRRVVQFRAKTGINGFKERPILSIGRNTYDTMAEQYYFKGKRYANLFLPRSLTKNKRSNNTR